MGWGYEEVSCTVEEFFFISEKKQMLKIHVIDYANMKCTRKRFTVELKNPVRSYAFFGRCFYRQEGGGPF